VKILRKWKRGREKGEVEGYRREKREYREMCEVKNIRRKGQDDKRDR